MIDLFYYEVEARAYLNFYRVYKWKIINAENAIARIEEEALEYGIKLDGLPKAGNISHPTEAAAFKLLKQRRKQEEEIRRCEEVRADVIDTIQRLNQTDPMLMRLLEARYIDGHKWEAIAKELHYSQHYVEKELHRKALDQVKIEMERKGRKVLEAYKGGRDV